jgi:hypothetical protein
MITKLTKKQEQKMYEYRDEGIRIGQDTTPIDHAHLEATISDLYKEGGLSEFNFLDFDRKSCLLLKVGIYSSRCK